MCYTEKFNELYESLRIDIIHAVQRLGKDSEVGFKTIKINKDELCFNLGGSSYIVEINEDNLFDQYGHQYCFSDLDMEYLCQLVDYINDLK